MATSFRGYLQQQRVTPVGGGGGIPPAALDAASLQRLVQAARAEAARQAVLAQIAAAGRAVAAPVAQATTAPTPTGSLVATSAGVDLGRNAAPTPTTPQGPGGPHLPYTPPPQGPGGPHLPYTPPPASAPTPTTPQASPPGGDVGRSPAPTPAPTTPPPHIPQRPTPTTPQATPHFPGIDLSWLPGGVHVPPAPPASVPPGRGIPIPVAPGRSPGIDLRRQAASPLPTAQRYHLLFQSGGAGGPGATSTPVTSDGKPVSPGTAPATATPTGSVIAVAGPTAEPQMAGWQNPAAMYVTMGQQAAAMQAKLDARAKKAGAAAASTTPTATSSVVASAVPTAENRTVYPEINKGDLRGTPPLQYAQMQQAKQRATAAGGGGGIRGAIGDFTKDAVSGTGSLVGDAFNLARQVGGKANDAFNAYQEGGTWGLAKWGWDSIPNAMKSDLKTAGDWYQTWANAGENYVTAPIFGASLYEIVTNPAVAAEIPGGTEFVNSLSPAYIAQVKTDYAAGGGRAVWENDVVNAADGLEGSGAAGVTLVFVYKLAVHTLANPVLWLTLGSGGLETLAGELGAGVEGGTTASKVVQTIADGITMATDILDLPNMPAEKLISYGHGMLPVALQESIDKVWPGGAQRTAERQAYAAARKEMTQGVELFSPHPGEENLFVSSDGQRLVTKTRGAPGAPGTKYNVWDREGNLIYAGDNEPAADNFAEGAVVSIPKATATEFPVPFGPLDIYAATQGSDAGGAGTGGGVGNPAVSGRGYGTYGDGTAMTPGAWRQVTQGNPAAPGQVGDGTGMVAIPGSVAGDATGMGSVGVTGNGSGGGMIVPAPGGYGDGTGPTTPGVMVTAPDTAMPVGNGFLYSNPGAMGLNPAVQRRLAVERLVRGNGRAKGELAAALTQLLGGGGRVAMKTPAKAMTESSFRAYLRGLGM